ncbi:Sodium/glucose cotransporter [Echinococcus granulosus]|uniref:Sodium/glucose cotransporter n=1 Tax=Echinococcus granulosus TaxID=6210 RepID=W6U4D9_ECHGR|nr:Sodium/glucose cotransporter [Echinococcus granulosus]EUB55978.1 Sodium/glucose cotransporter [Echinococcus granulosus]
MLLGHLDGADLGVLFCYFVIIFASSCRNRGSVSGYFLAGRSMHWIPVGASLFASNIGSGHFIGLAGSGASSGIAIVVFEFNACFVLAILGWLFVPVYIVSGIVTVPEYLCKRLGGQRIRVYLAVVALLLYIFTKISADLYAGGLFIQQAMQISIYPAIILLLVISALFTIMGGLTAVIWTDFAQTVIMVVGAFYLTIRTLYLMGGFESMLVNYFNGIPNTTRVYKSTSFRAENHSLTSLNPDLYGSRRDREAILQMADYTEANAGIYAECQIPPSDAMNFFKSVSSPDLPWTGAVFGLTINAVWYWCTDQVRHILATLNYSVQVIVQRTLAAKSLSHAKGGIILASVIKILPLWLMVVPGMIARVLFADTVTCGSAPLCSHICGKAVGCSDIAYPSLVLNVLPSGARGLMLAVMMASLVSSLTSIFNSASTIFTVDIWRLIRPQSRDAEIMIVGRVCVIVLVGIGIAWIPVVQLSDELFDYVQSVTGYLAPPICAVYVLAVFWKRTNENGCFAALIVGLVMGVARFGWELAYAKIPCGDIPIDLPHFLLKLHYLHFSILLFVIPFFVAVCVSFVTTPLPNSYTRRLVFSEIHTPFDPTLDGPKITIVSDEEKQRWLEEGKVQKPKPSGWRKAVKWFCGIEEMQDSREPVYTLEEARMYMLKVERQRSIEESAKGRVLTSLGITFTLSITIFICAFFA